MSQTIEVKVPDIGDYSDVPVIDICVKVGDTVKVDDALVTLESDKATMDVPSSAAGVVKEIRVALGDKISEGAVVVIIEAAGAATAAASAAPVAAAAPAPAAAPPSVAAPVAAAPAAASALVEVKVPDIGDYTDVPVIDICVKVGDTVKVDDALVTLESDKATMDVPSSAAGVIKEIKVKLGDKISEGSVVVVVQTGSGAAAPAAAPAAATAPAAAPAAAAASAPPPVAAAPAAPAPAGAPTAGLALGAKTHASPSVRAFARELGVDLGKVPATGPKGRILKEDIQSFVKGVMKSGPAPTAIAAAVGSLGGGLDLLPWPKVNFEKFGPVSVVPLSRIKKISGQNLARNWAMIPAVTYHEDADITDLEAFRVSMNKENEKSGVKITMLAFLIKACAMGLKKFPEFNSSLDGDNLVMKQYVHIAFAADTPNGLVVPVIKNADQKSVTQLVAE